MMECNCGGYYPVSTCPVCMPSKFYRDHAEELAKAIASVLKVMDCETGAQDAAFGDADKALANYREATK